eukprot:CAMPEP_0119034434 /NCGR_PEP_ID=MMETSP1177-20130426/1415_1 /TAXON_ID=2985 /ORGANISM="Ochromonas sp, Strain CCMP1899" /LENGTH=384 /DNA_ID=CAMNT_0006991859 /DNA_START=284 /DNA_END=1438 /DNA_ORIENTATION=-
MVGYGRESDNFVLELTYNYGINSYKHGDDMQYISVSNPAILVRAAALGYEVKGDTVTGPDGYLFKIIPRTSGQVEQFTAVCLKVSSLEKSQQYYTDVLQMKQVVSAGGEIVSNGGIDVYKQQELQCMVTYEVQDTSSLQTQTMLILIEGSEDGNGGTGGPIDHGLSGGRIAFGCGSVDEVYKRVTGAGEVVITPPLSLPTPGKADVVVTILSDPDGYEICFVEDKAFYDLATATYDVVDFEERASRGGDGNPPPRYIPPPKDTEKEVESSLLIATDEEFISTTLNAPQNKDKTVVLFFSASWCKNCMKIKPFIIQMAHTYKEEMVAVYVDTTDDNLQEVAMAYDVTALPRILSYQQGDKIKDYIGSNTTEIQEMFSSLLKPSDI